MMKRYGAVWTPQTGVKEARYSLDFELDEHRWVNMGYGYRYGYGYVYGSFTNRRFRSNRCRR